MKSNWKAEINKFSDLSVRILGEYTTRRGTHRIGSVKDRIDELKTPIEEFFIITNIETLRSADFIEAYNSKKNPNKFGMIAVDEVHKCLTGDTLIATSNGILTLEQIFNSKQLPKVLSYNVKTDSNEFMQIENIARSEPSENLLELAFDNGKTIKCTESHKIYTTNRG